MPSSDIPASVQAAASFALALVSIVLGVFAMWQAFAFHRSASQVSSATLALLAELKVTVRATEATTSQVTSRALDVLAGTFERRMEEVEHESRVRVAETVARVLAEASPRERAAAEEAAARAVSDAFVKLKTSIAPTAEEYDWGPFIRRMDELQRKNAYLSVKWLHQQVFVDEPGMREALQIAIDRGLLRTYERPNPRRPRYPTLCCELNRGHPSVGVALPRRRARRA